ncbi:hypothetical protein [Flindersiella endophytica]
MSVGRERGSQPPEEPLTRRERWRAWWQARGDARSGVSSADRSFGFVRQVITNANREQYALLERLHARTAGQQGQLLQAAVALLAAQPQEPSVSEAAAGDTELDTKSARADVARRKVAERFAGLLAGWAAEVKRTYGQAEQVVNRANTLIAYHNDVYSKKASPRGGRSSAGTETEARPQAEVIVDLVVEEPTKLIAVARVKDAGITIDYAIRLLNPAKKSNGGTP